MENPFAVHIKEQYRKICKYNFVGVGDDGRKCYLSKVVELKLIVKNKGEHFLARLRDKRDVSYHDIFKPVRNGETDPIRRVLIEGGAGMGKTSLSTSLSKDWANDKIFQEYDLLLFLPLCEEKVAAATSLFELIERLKLKVNSQKLESYVQDKRGGGLLVIADGWNHLSESERRVGSFFHGLLFGNTLSLVSVIVTSRPTASALLHNDGSSFVDKFIEVCGFNRESIEDHVRSELASAQPHTAAGADGLLARMDCNPVLQSMCSVPITCTKFCQLWHTPEAFPTTMTDLCTKIVLCILRQELVNETHAPVNTRHISSLPEIINALPKDMQDSWWRLCKLALETIDRNELGPTQLGGSFQCGMITFGLIEYDSTGVPDVSLNFTHPTVKEYLAATCLVKHPSLVRILLDSVCISRVAPPMFWTYLFGLADQNFLKSALKKMSARDVPKCVFCCCAFEAKNDVITSEVVKCLSIKNDSKTFVNFGDPHSMYDFDAMLYVMKNMKNSKCDGIEINCHTMSSMTCAISNNLICTLVEILLKHNTLKVRSLNLSENSLQDETVADLFRKAKSAFTSLERLILRNNSISANGISAIISSTQRLTLLDLSFNPLTKQSLKILNDAIKSCKLADLETLIMQGCLTDDADANIIYLNTFIGNLKSYCKHFEQVDISGNYLGKPGKSRINDLFQQVGGEFRLYVDEHYLTEDNVHFVAKNMEALMKKEKINYTVAHGVFVGPGRSGKNSLMNRLLGKGLDDVSPSTGVLESVVKAEVELCTVAELTDDIQWRRLDYDNEALELMMATAKCHIKSDSDDSKENTLDNSSPVPCFSQSIAAVSEQRDSGESEIDCTPTLDHSAATPDDVEQVYVLETVKDPTRDDATALKKVNKPQPVPYNIKSIEAESLEVFKRAVKLQNMSAIRKYLESSWTLYLSNTGGQMEFQELLPLLVCGPSVFFITFPLHHNLDEPYDVCSEFRGRSPTKYRSSHTLLDEILQTLATIATLDSSAHGLHTLEAAKPKVFFVGTHKDKLPESNRCEIIQQIDKQLQERVKQTSLYNPLGSIEFAIVGKQLIFPVNNLAEDEADFRYIRMCLHRVVKRNPKEFTISCPCAWLIFSLVLRTKYRVDQVLSYSECFTIAQRCGIKVKEINRALSFIHVKLGLIRYFCVDELNKFVIIDPQIIFNTITVVMNETFTKDHANDNEIDLFYKQGIFSLKLIQDIYDQKLVIVKDKLSLKWHLKLLEYLGIAASFDKHGKKYYFFPAVLCHAPERRSPIQTESAGRLPPPILIGFKSGFCPRGIAVRLIVHLMTSEKHRWKPQPKNVFRNEVYFSAGPSDVILRISCTHLELVFNPEWKISHLKIQECCEDVLKQLQKAMQIIIKKYHECKHFFALHCTCEDQHPHLAKIKDNGKMKWLRCTKTRETAEFPPNWFVGTLSMNEVVTENHLGQIADNMRVWEGRIAEELKLTPADVEAIKVKHPYELKLQCRGALRTWKERLGAAATYNNLVCVFVSAGYQALAHSIKELEPEDRKEIQIDFKKKPSFQTSHPQPAYRKVECTTVLEEPCLNSTHDRENTSLSASKKLTGRMATSAGSGRKERLTVDNVFEVLKLTNREWQWVAKRILEISSNKCEEINRRYSTDDERLRQAIQFWLKRCAFASWRFLLDQFHCFKLDSLALRIRGYTESILDDSLTSAEISAALDSMSDEDLGSFLVRHEEKRAELRRQSSTSEEYRILLINHWLNTFHTPTWEYLAGKCFLSKKEIPLRKIKEHFERMPESSLTLENLTEIQSEVKDWDIIGLPMQLGIQNAMTKELEDSYPDPIQRTETFIKMFLEEYPAPSWEVVCRALYINEEYDVLEMVQNKYYKGTSETRRHLQEAMKKGKGSTSITKVVLFGLPESGKTCTKHIILDEEPPQEYTSTPLALRPVTIYCVDIAPGQWRKLSRPERDQIVATLCQRYSPHRVQVSLLLDAAPSEDMHEEAPPTEPDTPWKRGPIEEPNIADMAPLPRAAPMPTSGRAALIRDAPKPKREAAVLYPSFQTQQNLLACLDTIQVKDRVFKIKRVQVSDCGGQPQFHEILPIFIRGTTLYLYVFKLNEALSSKPMIKYYDKGKPICDDYPGTETYEEILQHCLRVVRSQKATGEKLPQIMIIGTHKDKEYECKSETRETKNKKLAKLLLPEFKSEVKYYRQRPREVIFPINARNPGAEEKKIAAEIRRLIEIDCEAEAVDTPLLWLGLESLLEDLTEACGRDVILKSELFAAARSQLHIEDESALDAALRFLHEHNLVFYYPEILPDVVFANAQVLLNKVTELVRAAHEGMTSCMLQGELWQRFCDYALVSEVFLGKEEFQEHYIPDVFNHKHLMELFSKLLIFAPFNKTEVFVPAILKKLTKQELSEHRVVSISSCASPLVLTFPKHGGPLLGVFCATVGALLSEDNVHPCRWRLTMDSEDEISPSCLKRNCVQFSIEGHPGTVTIIDSFQYIEVHIHLSPQRAAASIDDLPTFCKMIRCSFVQALRKATLALHYNYNEPVVGFGCSCGDPTFHLASILADKKRWVCSRNRTCYDRLNKSQLMWLEDNEKVEEVVSLIESIPVLHELDLIAGREKEVRVMRIVAPHWERFSLRLHLRRETIDIIKKNNPQQAGDACQAMFNMWLNGVGRKPVSWGTLITALNEADLSEHAKVLGDIIAQK